MMRLDPVRLYDELAVRLAQDVPPEVDLRYADDAGAMPADVRTWLARLRLLHDVPFAYLVPDTELLPPESIRWFHLDRRWTDALVQGALSVGTVNSDDRTLLTASYPVIRAEVDHEERNQRLGADTVTALERRTGDRGPVTGFLLRSEAVSGWPAMHVRAFSEDPPEADTAPYAENHPLRIRVIRLERLAPAVLLALFDGVPEVVHLEEPRQGVQFGFEMVDADGPGPKRAQASVRVRDASTAEYIKRSGREVLVDVPFRTGASGVVDIKRLQGELDDYPEARSGSSTFDSAIYALQLIQHPWRQVWGESEDPTYSSVFKPTVAYKVMVEQVFRKA